MADKKLEIIIALKDLATSTMKALGKRFKAFGTKILPTAQRALKRFGDSMRRLKSSLLSFKGLLVGLGVGLLAKQFLDAAKTAENLRIRLGVLTGSVKEGNRMFKEMAELASQVPQTFEEIMESATRLVGVVTGGVDEVKQLMPLILDLSTATGLAVNDVTAQVIRMWSAGAAAADMFRERGVLAMLGFQAGATYSVDTTRKMLMEAWEGPTSKFRDAAKALRTTWTGLMSMIQDAWFQFRVAVMDEGLLDFLKGNLGVLLDQINALKADTGEYGNILERVSTYAINALKTIMFLGAGVIDTFRGIKMIVTALGLVFAQLAITGEGVWKGFKLLLDGSLLLWYKFGRGVQSVVNTVGDAIMWLMDRFVDLLNGVRELVAAVNAWDKVGLIPDSALKNMYDSTRVITDLIGRTKELSRENTRYWDSAIQAQKNALADTAFTDSAALRYWTENRDALKSYLSELSHTDPAVQGVMDHFDAVDRRMRQLEEERNKFNAEARARRAELKPEKFAFSEDEKAAQAAARGVLDLKAAMVELEHQYKTNSISAKEYYNEKKRLQDEQYSREVEALHNQLNKVEEIEVQRRKDVVDKIAQIDKQVEEGVRAKNDVATQNLRASLQAQLSDSRKYLEAKIEIDNKLYAAATKHQKKAYADQQAAAAAELDLLKATADAKADLLEISRDNELAVARANLEGAALLAEEQRIQEEQLAQEQQSRYAELEELFRQHLITKEELLRAHYEMDSQMRAVKAANDLELEKKKEEERKAAAEKAEKAEEAQLQNIQKTASLGASAFADMYKAMGEDSKEFFYAWKAMQIAQTIINTYAAAQAVFKGWAEMGTAGQIMAGVQAALTIAQGMARVAIIRSQTLAAGGEVGGSSPSPTADNIPALLTAGEFVHPVSAVKHYGLGAMEAIRRQIVPKAVLSRFSAGGLAPPSRRTMRFAAGGSIPSPASTDDESGEGGSGAVNITNVVDPQVMEQYVASKPGERSIMNVISRNQFALKQLMAD